MSLAAVTNVAGFWLSFLQAVEQQGDRHVEKRTSDEEDFANALAEVQAMKEEMRHLRQPGFGGYAPPPPLDALYPPRVLTNVPTLSSSFFNGMCSFSTASCVSNERSSSSTPLSLPNEMASRTTAVISSVAASHCWCL